MPTKTPAKAATPPKPQGLRAPPALYREPLRLLSPADVRGEQWRVLIGQAPIVRSCVQTLVMQLTGIEWYIESEDEQSVEYFSKVLETGDDGAGFETFVSRVVEDSLVLPFGGAAEFGHFPDGVVAWMAHLDAATMVPTYDPNYPFAQIDPWTSGRPPVTFREEQIGRVRWQAETRSKSYGWTKTPCADALPAIQALLRADRFWQSFLSDSPPAGILDVMDMTEDEARSWWESWMQMMAGPDPFKVALLYGGGGDRDKPATFIPFQKGPGELSMMEVLKLYAQEVTACFGMTIGDLGLFDQELRLAGATRIIDLTKKQGLARVMRGVRTMINNDVLPDHATFTWAPVDVEDAVRKAAAAKARADSIKIVKDTGIINPMEARNAIVTFGIISEEDLDPNFEFEEPAPEPPRTPDLADDEMDKTDQPTGSDVQDDMKGRSYIPPRAFPLNSPIARQMTTIVDKLLRPATRGLTKKRAQDLLDIGLRSYTEGAAVGEVQQRARADAKAALESALAREDWWRSPNLVDEVSQILSQAYTEGLAEAARDIEHERLALGFEGVSISTTTFNLTHEPTLQLIRDRAGAFITRLDESTRRFIVDAILRGVQTGVSSPKIAREILADTVRRDLIEKWRHRTLSITNTEIGTSESHATLDQQRSLGLTLKRWNSVAGLACNICAANDAQGSVPNDFMFQSVFGPVLAPVAHPNVCHCWLTFDKTELKALKINVEYWTGGDL